MVELRCSDANKGGKRGHIAGREIADRINARFPQPVCRMSADQKQLPHRHRPELARDLVFKERMRFVGLFHVARHLGKQLIVRDTDIDRKPKLRPDALPDRCCRAQRVRPELPHAGHVKITFIDRGLLEHRRIISADRDKAPRALFIPCPVRRRDNKFPAFLHRHRRRLSGMDAEFRGRNRLCGDDARTEPRISADNRGDIPQITLPFPQTLYRRPRKKRAVYIHMENQPPFLFHHTPHKRSSSASTSFSRVAQLVASRIAVLFSSTGSHSLKMTFSASARI